VVKNAARGRHFYHRHPPPHYFGHTFLHLFPGKLRFALDGGEELNLCRFFLYNGISNISRFILLAHWCPYAAAFVYFRSKFPD
jgi:membrane protein DedA with SNARE-associated domain